VALKSTGIQVVLHAAASLISRLMFGL